VTLKVMTWNLEKLFRNSSALAPNTKDLQQGLRRRRS
jgi:hypothetical protein